MYEDEDNDGKFPDESPVEFRYPRSKREEQADRDTWPWLPGSVVEQCGPDEWYVCIEVRELAVLRDGRRAVLGDAIVTIDSDDGITVSIPVGYTVTGRTRD